MSRFAWVLNLDADDELAEWTSHRSRGAEGARSVSATSSAPLGGAKRVSRDFVRARVAERVTELSLLVAGGVLVGHGRDADARGLPGRAFCPTPRALAELRAVGATLPDAPTLTRLAESNHRLFCAALGQTLDGALWLENETDLEGAFAERVVPSGREWVLKHPHGYVGRLRHRTRELDLPTRSFASRCFGAAQGLQLEPWVERRGDYAIHGFLSVAGRLTFGAPTRQLCDARGVWQGTTRSHDLSHAELDALHEEGRRVADSLHESGYFGPFGVDAFRYVDVHAERETTRFNPRCEVNARYTMGWAIGMGETRPDLVEV